ncbi:MAG: ATP-binding protein [Bacteroidales bacterium]|nr:ATP-binding protein [Bacteroidales bacterium]
MSFYMMNITGQNLKFKSFKTDDGLSGSTVSCFYKTKNNLLWIGSDKGIDLFTGRDFIPLKNFIADSVSHTQVPVTSMVELQKNSIWAGTWGDGIFNVNIETGEYKHYRAESNLNSHTISDNYINCLKVFEEQLWIGTNYCLSQKSGDQFIHYTFEEVLTKGIPDIRAIVPKYRHLLSIFTNAGEIIELNTQTGTYHKVADIKAPIKNITCIEKDKENRYWIGTEYSGLILLDENYQLINPASSLVDQLSNSHLSDIVAHPEHGIFISSDGGGLYIVNPANYSFKRIRHSYANTHSLTSNQLESLYFDSDGLLWAGYFKGGFSTSMYESDGIEHIYKTQENNGLLPNKNVNCFAEDFKNNIWVGTESGLAIFDNDFKPAKQTLFQKKIINELKELPVTSLSSSKNHEKIYAGTYNNGLFVIDLKQNKITNHHTANSDLESNFIRDVKELNDAQAYVATVDGGFYKYKNERFEKVKVYFADKYEIQDFFHIELINNEKLWLSSAGKGALRISTPSGSGEVFESILSTICYSSCINADSSTFIATNKGIFKYDKASNTFKALYSGRDAIDFYGIIEVSQPYLWISSSSGLHRFNKNTNLLETVSSPNLQSKEFNPGAFYKRHNGQLLFGGTNGFNIISTDQFSANTKPGNLFISELKIYNTSIKPRQQYDEHQIISKQINYTKELRLSHNIDLFSIRVEAIDYYSQSTGIAYTISKNGNQSEIFYTDGEIPFVNMQPGKYKLKIYPAHSSNGIINNTASKEITIVKEAPWWQSYWLFAALFLSIISIILALHLLRIRELRKAKRTLQKKVTERTAALLSQKERLQYQKNSLQEMLAQNKKLESFKESIINMIVHDLKNPLNGIIGLSSLNEAEYLEHINSASRQMLCLVENILDVRRYETHSLKLFYQQCDIRQLVNESIDEVRFLLKDNQIEILNLITPLQVSIDKDIIRRVYINLLTNAIKYSKVNGKITLRSTLTDERKEKMLLLSVQDEGHGIPEKYRESIFDLYQQVMTKKSGKANSNGLGLSFCKIAVNEHGGKIWVDSEIGKGATFFIQMPLQNPFQ